MHDWIVGMDVSSLVEVEDCGGKFYDNGIEGDALSILKAHGANMVRLRLWNDPYDAEGNSYSAGYSDIKTVLKLAKRASKLGLDWLLDLHYSDCWADPGKQTIPKAWQGMNVDELETAVYEYTLNVLKECEEAGLKPQMVAIGNELSNGLLWPYAKVPEYANIARFVSAGIRASREFDAKIPVMIHLDNGGNNELYRRWFDNYFANNGLDFEYIGLSYYPFWHGTLDMLRDNMNDIASRYGKKLIVAEVSMGFTLDDYKDYEKLPDELRKGMATKKELAEKVPFPMTPEGQRDFMKAFLDVIHGIRDNMCEGYFYWEPAWLPVPGSEWATAAACEYMHEKGPGGNEWANQALFDYDGNALCAMDIIVM